MKLPLLVAPLLGMLLPSVVAAAEDQRVRYDGHVVVRATIASERDLHAMLRLSDDVWSDRVGLGPVDFRIRPEALSELAAARVPYTVLIPDVQALIDEERARLARPAEGGSWFDDYKDLDAIHEHLTSLAALRPDLAQRVSAGTSLQRRRLRGIRITNDAAGAGQCKPAMVFAATQHAREWITPMVTTYLAESLVSRYDSDPAIKDLVDRVEFLIVPVANPDGYVYTWQTDRLWRKNRRVNAGTSCRGVDLNRNWGYQWGESNGSSGQPCSDLYRGPAPFSEPETASLRDFVLARPQVRYLHDMHSYGQLLLQPWGYTATLPPGHATYESLGAAMSQLIQAVHGKVYVHGPVYTTIYPANGVSSDWAWGAAGAYAFGFELRGEPGGFILPREQIVPNAEEILPALLHLARFIADEFPFKADLNGDCIHSAEDFLAFQTAFAAGAPAADLTGDGAFTLDDAVAFRDLFARGR
jgi:murein tripeptide amidase MpaA